MSPPTDCSGLERRPSAAAFVVFRQTQIFLRDTSWFLYIASNSIFVQDCQDQARHSSRVAVALCPPSMWSVSFRPLHAGSRRAGRRCLRAGVREAWAGPQTPCRAVVAWSRAVCLADSPGLACVCPAPGVHALTKAFLYHRDSLLYTWTHRRREEGREGAFSPPRAGELGLGGRR